MVWAKGLKTKSLCDRCGLTYEYLLIVNEKGTKYRVCNECNDGKWNLIDHPQNHVNRYQRDEGIVLRYPRPDTAFVSIGTPTSVWEDLTGWN